MASWDDFPAVATAPQEGWDKFPKVEDDPWSKFPAADSPPPKPESPTPASDKALSETPVSPVDARLQSFGVDTAAPESFYKPEEHPTAEAIAKRGLAFAEGAGVPTSLQGLKEMGKFLVRSPIQDVKDIYGDITLIPSRIANFGQTIASSPAATVYREPLSPEAFGIYGTAAGMLAPALMKRGGELNAVERGNAQVQEGTAPFGVEARPEGQIPKPSDSNNVVGETSGEGGLARPPQETPQPVAGQDISTLLTESGLNQAVKNKIERTIQQFSPNTSVKFTSPRGESLVSRDPTTGKWRVTDFGYDEQGNLAPQRHDLFDTWEQAVSSEAANLNTRAQPVPEVGQTATVAGEKPTVGADVGAVPPIEANEPHVSAIANRFVEERAARGELGRITPGRGFSREDLVQGGLTMPPEVINQHVSDLMQGTGDIVKQGQAVRAEEARLSARSNQLSRVAESNPQNMEAKMAADNAFKDLEDFHNGPVATLKQKWHATGLEMQGEIPVDLSTFNGLRQQWLRDVGEAPPAKVEPELRRAAQNVSKAIVEDNGARSKLAQAIDKEATRRKYPSADEVRNNIRDRMGLEPCRT